MKDATWIGLQICARLLPFPPSLNTSALPSTWTITLQRRNFEKPYFYISAGKKPNWLLFWCFYCGGKSKQSP